MIFWMVPTDSEHGITLINAYKNNGTKAGINVKSIHYSTLLVIHVKGVVFNIQNINKAYIYTHV